MLGDPLTGFAFAEASGMRFLDVNLDCFEIAVSLEELPEFEA